jgi:ATP-dependent DNA helicase RecQ
MVEKSAKSTPPVFDTLKKVFGFQSFRPNQEEIVNQILASKDVFAVMPTGGGKSLCYQLPAKLMDGTTVVISPLISLMKDQVDAAVENGISAAFINSSLTTKETAAVFQDLRSNSLDLLYIAPERFAMQNFLETLKTVPISLFAIDEAHCVSEWGHDFRPDYMALSVIADTFPNIPVAAFTATATRKVQNDIIDKLRLRSPFTIRASFNRPNLIYRVESKRGLEKQLLDVLGKYRGEPGIIYRTTRDSVTAMAEMLKLRGIKALPYHAGLPQEERKANQEAFNTDEIDIIVATIAFGMGIDKSNVRFVIHADLPKNIEGYYQETGRSGRDGEPAECILYFGRGDIPKIKYFIDQIEDENEKRVASDKLNKVVRYASHNVCRRRQLLGYFGEEYPDDNCGTCDICTGKVEIVDITIDAQIIMSAMSRTGQRFGIMHIIDIVLGANTKRIRDLEHDKIKTYGAGKDRDRYHWHFIIDELLVQDVIQQDGDKYPILKISEKGKKVLFGKDTISALKREEPKRKKRAGKESELGPYDEELFELLRTLRKKLADKQHVPPYIIFSDKTLHEMCRSFPATPDELTEISGVGNTKLERYGDAFLGVIRSHKTPATNSTD